MSSYKKTTKNTLLILHGEWSHNSTSEFTQAEYNVFRQYGNKAKK